MTRLRSWTPGPHVLEQAPQVVHSLTSVSPSGHTSALHPLVSMRLFGHSDPPFLGNSDICRWRLACPAPQVLSHCPQWVHSDILQLIGSKPQDRPSLVSPAHGSPPFCACFTILLSRNCMWFWSQVLHSPQSPISHEISSSVILQCRFREHFLSSRRAPSHGVPPRCAWDSIARLR